MAQALPTSPPSKLDGEHYWDFVTFSVEGCLFRLPKYRFLEESEHFCKEYDLDHGSLAPTEEPEYANIDAHSVSSPSPNSNQRDPVVKLEGVNLGDFRCFLKVLYPRNGEHELAGFTPEQWGSVLKLSTKWFFNDIRHRAIKEIDTVDGTMSDVNRIVLAKEYGILEWLLAGYKALITREEIIDLEEGEKIGLRNALQLYQLRDKYYRQDWDGETLKTEIMWKFAVEIEKMQSTEREYFTKVERKAAEEEKARADEELEAAARARQMALYLSEGEEARRKAVEQCEKSLELKRKELAQMEKAKDELLASAYSHLEEKEGKAICKRERTAIEAAAATPERRAGEAAVEAKSEESVVGTKEEEHVTVPKVEDLLSAEKQESAEAQTDGPVPEAKVEDVGTEVAPSAEPQPEEAANATDKGPESSATEQVKSNGAEGLTIQTAPAINDPKANDAEGTDSPVGGPDSKADERKARKKAEKAARKKAKRLAEEKAAAAQEATAESTKPEPAAEATANAPAEKVKLETLITQNLSKADPLIDFSATLPSPVQPALPPPTKNNEPSSPTSTHGGRVPLNERLSKPTPFAWPPITNSTNNGAWSWSPSSAEPKNEDGAPGRSVWSF